MMSRLTERIRRIRQDESGATAAIVVICMTALLGMLGLVVDGGVLFLERTELQKAVDAAALAGAQAYSVKSDGTCSAPTSSQQTIAGQYAQSNHLKTDPTISYPSSSTGTPNGEVIYDWAPTSSQWTPPSSGIWCAWTVTARRGQTALGQLPLPLPIVLGGPVAVTASATAVKTPLSRIDEGQALPYAIWGGNADDPSDPDNPNWTDSLDCYDLHPTDGSGGLDSCSKAAYSSPPLIIRDVQWIPDVVYPDPANCANPPGPPRGTKVLCNPNWNIPSGDNFKGFLHLSGGTYVCDPPTSSGGCTGVVFSSSGTASESAAEAQYCQLVNANQPAVIVIITYACKAGVGSCPSSSSTSAGDVAGTVGALRAITLDPSPCGGRGGGGGISSGTELSGWACKNPDGTPCSVTTGQGGGTDPNAPMLVKLVQ